MSATEQKPPKVFISYSHDSPEHIDRVSQLSDRLRGDGINGIIDQYEFSPAEGWPTWCNNQIEESDFVLIVCTETYYRRFTKTEAPEIGHGVRWEGHIISQELYDAGALNRKFIPVLFSDGKPSHIPTPLRSASHCLVDTEEGYEALYRHLTNQPPVRKRELGKLRKLPPRERKQKFLVLWNLPARNAFFTGRDEVLEGLHEALARGGAAALSQPLAISGLGGIGKTQAAIEYAYRYRDEYKAVFWVRAESPTDLVAGYVEIAKRLDLPLKEAQNQNETVQAVRRWLVSDGGWLLIFDNADKPELVKEFLPWDMKGQVLVTSRAQVFDMLGIPKPIDLGKMRPDEALSFLFRRTGREAKKGVERDTAGELAKELGYFPLALEQAGAYIAAKQSRFQDYLSSYKERRLELLEQSPPVTGDYEESVATTWSMNFLEVEKASEASAELLRFSAFLAPDDIPLELLLDGASELGPVLAKALAKAESDSLILDELLAPLTRFSLIRRHVDSQTYSLHRLVQEVLKDGMDEKARRIWAERTVQALNAVFPLSEYRNWLVCQRLLPQVMVAVKHVADWGFDFEAAARLLNNSACYLDARARYGEAEVLQERALGIWEKALGPDHPDVATGLNNLAELYGDQGKYVEAEPLHERALAIREKALGRNHPDVGDSLNNLAALYYHQGKYAEAEPVHKRALAIREKALGPNHPDVAASLNNLAELYRVQGKYGEAEPLSERALGVAQKALGPKHPDVASSLGNLGELYREQRKHAEAEALHEQALAIREKALGPDHPDVAVTLHALALLYHVQGKYGEAESLCKQVLAIWEKALGPDHPNVATALCNLAEVYREQRKHAEAEALHKRALAIREKALGPDHPSVANSLHNLALLYRVQGKYGEAEPLYERALRIAEKALGPEHPKVATVLTNYAVLLRKMGRDEEARGMKERAKQIRAKHGPEIPDSQ